MVQELLCDGHRHSCIFQGSELQGSAPSFPDLWLPASAIQPVMPLRASLNCMGFYILTAGFVPP